jgi:hypothetical protein
MTSQLAQLHMLQVMKSQTLPGTSLLNWVWWFMPVNPMYLGDLDQEDHGSR